MHTSMHTSMRILLLILALLLQGGIACAEDEGEGSSRGSLDSLTKVGLEAQARFNQLVEIYERTMYEGLRGLITDVRVSTEEQEWRGKISFVLDVAKVDRGSALHAYRSWVAGNGGDASLIKGLPSDWAALLDGNEAFYDLCNGKGTEAFVALLELVKDADTMHSFVWKDDMRLDFLEARGKDIDSHLTEADILLANLQSGKKTLNQVKPRLEKLRGTLKRDESGLTNCREVVKEILAREKKYNSTDNAAVNRKTAVRNAFDAFTDAVRANEKTSAVVHEAEAEVWRGAIEKTLETYEKHQNLWLDRIEIVVNSFPFPNARHLKGKSLDDCIETIGDMIGRIDHAL